MNVLSMWIRLFYQGEQEWCEGCFCAGFLGVSQAMIIQKSSQKLHHEDLMFQTMLSSFELFLLEVEVVQSIRVRDPMVPGKVSGLGKVRSALPTPLIRRPQIEVRGMGN